MSLSSNGFQAHDEVQTFHHFLELENTATISIDACIDHVRDVCAMALGVEIDANITREVITPFCAKLTNPSPCDHPPL
jgi:hypothetical protein